VDKFISSSFTHLFIYSFPHHSLLTPFSWFPFIMEDASGNQLFLFYLLFLEFS
jgi:hypothetical protein